VGEHIIGLREGRRVQPLEQPAVIRVLLVEDDREDAILVRGMVALSEPDRFIVVHVDSLTEARHRASAEVFDVLLLDLSLPGLPGLAGLSAAQSAVPGVPIVAMAGPADESLAMMAMDMGAQDYLVKRPGNRLSSARIRRAMERNHDQAVAAVRDARDPVTGLTNRDAFRDALHLARSAADKGDAPFTLMLIDLDRFRAVNEVLGHAGGDQFLRAVAERLERNLPESDVLARLGGDEFAVLAFDTPALEDGANRAQGLLEVLSRPYHLDSHELFVTPSIGITLYPSDAENVDEVMKKAESALFAAKKRGRNNFQWHDPESEPPALERMKLESALRRALDRDEFLLYYQAQVDLASGAVTGTEALLRWDHPQLGLVSPGQFIWLAEETGLIVPIGEWVIETACKQARAWDRSGLPPLRMVVNLSARQFRQPRLVESITATLSRHKLPADRFAVEITEGALMDDTRHTRTALAELREAGVRISIDDFGIGYSSLGYLKRFPVDILKIDQSFVRDLATDPGDQAITRAILALGRGLGLDVVAEGVEQPSQLAFLRAEGCPGVQGYLLSRPKPARQFEAHMRRGVTLPC